MNYYNEIKQELVNNEIYKKVKDYSKNKNDLMTYYNVGKLLSKARKHYGDGIIKEYSIRLTSELGKGYTISALKRMRQFYNIIEKGASMRHLSWTHYRELIPLKDINQINYYLKITEEQNLSVRELRKKVKNKEYERLDDKTKEKLIKKENTKVNDFIKNPILIKNSHNYEKISESILKKLIIEDLDNFLTELGDGFTYIKCEYKIKIGTEYNYIDLLLFNYIYNCFVVVELKVTELKKDHIGQIQVYMNYIDKHIKNVYHDKTIGIIICKKGNNFILEYASDERIYETVYKIGSEL